MNARLFALAFAGGALGTAMRIAIAELLGFGLNASASALQIVGLFVANVLGAAALGWLNGDSRFASPARRAFWATGVAGGFTTLSGVAIWLVFAEQLSATALALIALQLALGLGSYWLARRIAKKRDR